VCYTIKHNTILDFSIKQLFLKYIQNRTSPDETIHVLSLMKSDAYQEEWEQALIEFQSEFEAGKEEADLEDQKVLFEKIKVRTRAKTAQNPLRWIGYAAAVLLVATITYLAFKLVEKPVLLTNKAVEKPIEETHGHKWIKLSDGTSVQLNSNSHLEYASDFKGKRKREVTLYGEAFFDVAHDPAHPFIIHTGKITTTVLGTAFNISAYDNKKAITVTVVRGKVMVQNANETLAVLTPNQQLNWQADKEKINKRSVNIAQAIAWKAQDLIMDDITLLQAADLISKRYGVEVLFKNNKVKTCRFTAAFLNRNDISQVTEVLTAITGATFERNGNQLVIDGAGCEN
jgi:ferric-dicitrate binding protein FerR (iron transport regulator)